MIIELPKSNKPEINPAEWHEVFCLMPRIIGDCLVWLSRVERRQTGIYNNYDPMNPISKPIYEYRLIEWWGY